MQLASAGHLETLGGVSLLDAEGNVRIQLAEQSVADVTAGDIFSFLTGERGVVYHELHGNGRLTDLLERDRSDIVGGAERVADVDIGDTGDGNDGADASLLYLDLVQTVKLIELADLYLDLLVGLVVVTDYDILIYADCAVVHLADADTSDILVVIDCADEHLCAGFGVSLGSGNVVQDGFKQGLHARAGLAGFHGSDTRLGGSIDERTVELGVVCIQLEEQLKNLVNDLVRSCLGAVDLIDTYNYGKLQLKSLAENELCLGHCTLKGIHNKDDAVYHFQDTFHLAAEVSVAGGVDNVDLCVLVHDGGVLGQNGNTALTFNIVGVHDTLRNLLTGTEHAALFQKLINQCGFAVVNVGDYGNISYIFSFLSHFYLHFCAR